MHTYKAPGGTMFNYNSDFSGRIAISTQEQKTHRWVPAEDIIRFFVDCWLTPKITRWVGTFVDDLSDIMSRDWS